MGWACNLLTALLGHWEKRNARAMEANVRPTNLDTDLLAEFLRRYGSKTYAEKLDELLGCLSLVAPFKSLEELTACEYNAQLDDFAAAGITAVEDLRQQCTEHLYFGCEADDVITAWAFDRHGNHRLKPIFSADVGHFDVVDMSAVLEEAYELVEQGLLTFTNAATLHTALNPDCFTGTVVEEAVARLVQPVAARA